MTLATLMLMKCSAPASCSALLSFPSTSSSKSAYAKHTHTEGGPYRREQRKLRYL